MIEEFFLCHLCIKLKLQFNFLITKDKCPYCQRDYNSDLKRLDGTEAEPEYIVEAILGLYLDPYGEGEGNDYFRVMWAGCDRLINLIICLKY
jgi:hypothetical protein